MKKNLVIYGIGKFSQYVRYLFENDSTYEVVAYCIEEKLFNSNFYDEKPLEKFEDIEKFYPPDSHELFIAVGNNKFREKFFNSAKLKGYNLASYISSKAQYWPDLKIGENVFISEGSVIQPFVSIGDNSILIASNIGHHSLIKNHSLLSVTTLGGDVKIGDFSFVGMNSVIKHGVRIAEYTLIGMNINIEKDTQPYSVYSKKESNLRDIDSSKLIDRLLL